MLAELVQALVDLEGVDHVVGLVVHPLEEVEGAASAGLQPLRRVVGGEDHVGRGRLGGQGDGRAVAAGHGRGGPLGRGSLSRGRTQWGTRLRPGSKGSVHRMFAICL